MIIGTAGHIDHGKTTLVRALTGVDTDRLAEEKRRGISIELGYAYQPLENGEVLGFIDVPGHERLVHTMVAGACGIDFALLVVAADDGVMPQTREHLAILELLGIGTGAVALTKIDRVDAERRQSVQTEIAAALAPTPLRAAPCFHVNGVAADDPGTAALARFLHERAMAWHARRDRRLFRLAVDRVFTLPGHGTVVAGTVFAGEVRPDDSVAIMPAGLSARVRSLHAQNRPAAIGRAGERCALNLAGIERTAVTRGDWLAAPPLLAPTTRVDVCVRLLPGRDPPLPAWAPLHVHLGTVHGLAHATALEDTTPSPGTTLRMQLVFDRPICCLPGDRFILRNAQATRTVGGGVVLDPFAPARKRRTAGRRQYLDALEQLVAGAGIGALLQQSPHGLRFADLVRLTGLPAGEVPLPAGVARIACGREEFLLLTSQWTALRERALNALRVFHAQAPEEPGPDSGRLRRLAAPGIPDALWRALIEDLVRERVVLRRAPWLHLPDHVATLSEADRTLAQALRPLLAAGHFDPPWVRALAARTHQPEQRVREVLRKLVTEGSVYQVVHDLFYDASCVSELAGIAGALAREHGTVSAARYRDALGLGRKRTIQILEFFDRVGYMRRVRDAHVVRQDSGWQMSSGS